MTRVFRLAAFALVSGWLGVVAYAQAPALNIKLGEWEISSVMNVGGQLPIDTSKMTPEQKAKMEASMDGRGARHASQQDVHDQREIRKRHVPRRR